MAVYNILGKACEVDIFKAGGTISEGAPIQFSTASSVGNPVPNLEVSMLVPTVVVTDDTNTENVAGVALEDAVAGDMVAVCRRGICDVLLDATGTAADRALDSTAAGVFTYQATPAAPVVARSLEAISGSTLGKAYINAVNTGLGML